MAFKDDMTTATEGIIDALGETASYCPDGGGTITTVTVVFDRTPQIYESEDGSVMHYAASATGKSSDLPTGYVVGDGLSVDGSDYVIRTHEVDEYGQVHMLLSLQ